MQLLDETERPHDADLEEAGAVSGILTRPLILQVRKPHLPIRVDEVFSAPRPASMSNGPVVILRKAKGVLPRPPSPDPIPCVPEAKERSPRVFRLEASRQPSAEPGKAASAGKPATQDLGRQPSSVRGRRRLPPDKRPGLVVSVEHARPSDRIAQALATVDASTLPQGLRYDELLAELHSLETVFAEIGKAQAFEVVDERFAIEWERLSCIGSEIRVQITSVVRSR